jgi:hypothetical protein
MTLPTAIRARAVATWLEVAAALLAPVSVGAWPASLGDAAARDARRLLPHSFSAALGAREAAIRAESERLPPALMEALKRDLALGNLSTETMAAVDVEVNAILAMFRKREVGAGLVRLGALARVPAALSDPVAAAGAPAIPEAVTGEYYLFVQGNLAKIPVVLADPAALELGRADLASYWQRLLDQSRAQAAIIPGEMVKNGQVVSHRSIDFRSPVFGVASLSYSRAVTAIAATWLVVWREARGDMSRRPKTIEVSPLSPAPAPAGGGAGPLREESRP